MKLDISAIDIYAKSVTFNLGGKTNVKSNVGAFFTLCTFATFLAYAITRIDVLLFHKSLNVSIVDQNNYFDSDK
jgi:hypothetical protein